ncbi:neuronal acetylcholine receptor subunit alpha-7 [Lingula anatina]|uniref:Neuronal acetylcholine receptor subunit alpha-7 n=1 Tax=Lingula anatina TaxID=7574 RepID=A0A1S3JAB0_LINAN|nr:neuronal acetylcholine receptor subunit alpha-7 [Lingula anatina]|eukprot:XP_013406819.1 neuronal acetylcholine receptor subunit alpha-7 [Lingula anatina]
MEMLKKNCLCTIFLPFLIIFCCFPPGTEQGYHQRRLLDEIFKNRSYNLLERPVKNESEALEVTFGLTLQQIIDVDEKNQVINTNIWLNLYWHDYTLTWNSSEYGGITSIRLPAKYLWKPDVLLYNSADEKFDGTFPTNVVIYSNGLCQWVPPGMFKSTCKIDITWFPFDDQLCKMKFGSWTHDGTQINLLLEKPEGDTSSFIPNGEWNLIGVPGKRNVLLYDCCPDNPYIDVTYTIHIRRRTLYYGFNLILPCVLLSAMSLFIFLLPPDAGEKISLGVTMLLSLFVFLLLVAETMPPTSDAVPLIGMYFGCIMIVCSLSVVFTVLVLNYHFRSPDTHVMPRWVKVGICEWLAWILRMTRPDRELTRAAIIRRSNMRELEMKERASKSLLVNVLDMDDDHIRSPKTNGTPFRIKVDNDIRFSPTHHSNPHACATKIELRNIHRELKHISDKLKKKEQAAEVRSEWMFAARVIDRLCIWLFTIFTVTSTCVIIFSAPHLFD